MKSKSPPLERMQVYYFICNLMGLAFLLTGLILGLALVFTDLGKDVSMLQLFLIGFIFVTALFFRVWALEWRNRINQKEFLILYVRLRFPKKG